MTKNDILQQLEVQYQFFLDFIEGLHQKDYLYSYQQKWTAGQQLKHLVLSVQPLVQLYKMSSAAIEQMFGKTDRANQSYQQLTAAYLEKLNEGGKAPSRFLPDPVSSEQKRRTIQKTTGINRSTKSYY